MMFASLVYAVRTCCPLTCVITAEMPFFGNMRIPHGSSTYHLRIGTMRTFTTLLAAALIAAAPLTAGLLPGQDAYAVKRDAVTLPNGVERSASTAVIHRPLPGTFVPGFLIVKTREPHGAARNHSSIVGSPVNRDLADLNVRDINSAFPTVMDGEASRTIGLDRVYTVRYDAAMDPFDVCAKLMDNPDVEYAVPVRIHQLFLTPNDPRYGQQPWMGSMKANLAWDVTKGSTDVLIAIIDSGTDWQHEDLSSKIWTNPGETPNNGRDDDGNGYVDDVRGWDFVGNITTADAQAGILRPDNDPRVTGTINDNTAHGTVVGGCAGAATNNAKGVASTGFDCQILPIKCGSDNPSFGGILQGYQAIAYAADLGADIINCSWGGPGIDPGAQDIVDYATAKGSLVVAASGNDGLNNDSYLQSPASLENVLSVGSCSVNDRVSNFSNYGMNVDVYAPGENILSTYPNNQYRGLTGTSFSSPLTSGVAALVKALHPDWTPEMIAAQIRGTVDPLQNIPAGNRPLYWGRVNAERAVTTNRSWTTGSRMPGLIATNISIGTTGKITSFERTTVRFTLKNVLADAQNVVVVIQLLDPGAQLFGSATVNLGSVARNAEATGSFDLQLDPNYPWYAADLRVGLTISAAGNYTAFEPIVVPVDITTTNEFTGLVDIPSSAWSQMDYTADGTLYATGSIFGQSGMIRGTQSGGGGFVAIPFLATALEAINSVNVLIGGLNGTTATIGRSTTGGSQWAGTNVSGTMASVEGIRMFDAQNGIAIGNPVAGKFGVMRTTNGGAAWTAVATAPTSSGQERIVRGAVYFRGDAVWFATTNGRVIGSLNRGQNWSQGNLNLTGSTVVSLAFRDSSNGIVLYRTSSDASAPSRVASTTNGGTNWRGGTADLALGTRPVRAEANTGHHLLIGANGEVFGSDNNGAAWQVILSMPAGSVATATAMMLDRPTVFMAGAAISMLQYRYSGPNGTKLPEFSTTQLGFGTMQSGEFRNRVATLRNTGTSDLTISSFEVVAEGSTPANAFTITTQPRTTVTAGGSINIPMRATGSDTGTYTGKLRVRSDGNPSVIDLALFAQVTPVVSVWEDLSAMGAVNVWPIPASDRLSVSVYAPSQITLFSIDGRVIISIQAEPGTTVLDVSALPPGSYHLMLVHGLGIRSIPVMVQR